MTTQTRPEFKLHHRLKRAREEAEISTEAMRKHFRVSRGTISNWERGAVTPRSRDIEEWADYTGVDLAWLDPEHDLRSRCSSKGAA